MASSKEVTRDWEGGQQKISRGWKSRQLLLAGFGKLSGVVSYFDPAMAD